MTNRMSYTDEVKNNKKSMDPKVQTFVEWIEP